MARRYTITNVTETGSGVQSFRNAISGSTTPGSANKGYSSDDRMKAMFPKSPLYNAASGYNNDSTITNYFKSNVIDIISQSNYDFVGTDVAYMNFTHPQSPDLDMTKLNEPISGSTSEDKPYYGHPNLQVNSVNPFDIRTVSTGSDGGLLRERTVSDGGFGRKYKTNYATSRLDDTNVDPTSTIVNIGQYFSKIYNSNIDTQIADSKKNLLGSSRATSSGVNSASVDDKGNPLQ